MKLYCEVNLKDRSPLSIQDAIAYACRHDELWQVRLSKKEQREEMPKHTSLEGKCGSCKSSQPVGDTCYVTCDKGFVCRPRSTKKCTQYERKEQ